MKKILYACFLLFGAVNSLKASHAAGIDLRYEWLGGDSARVIITLYRDCSGISAPAYMNLSASNCGSMPLSFSLYEDTTYQASPLPISMWPQSACNGGNLPGIEVHEYVGIVHLTSTLTCVDWTLSITECCRNCAITNLVNPCASNLYAEVNLYGSLVNNSPDFSSIPVTWICQNQAYSYNHSAFDADGDSLVFTLQAPLDGDSTSIPFNVPFSATNPLSTDSTGFSFNPYTGQMDFTPTSIEVAALSVLVEEYRNGQLIGSTMRDLQLYVVPCDSNNAPIVQRPVVTSGASSVSFMPDANGAGGVFRVVNQAPFTFTQIAQDDNSSQQLTVTSNIEQAIPGATFSVTGTQNVVVEVSIPALTEPKTFSITYTDNAEPIVANKIVGYAVYPVQSLGNNTVTPQALSFKLQPQPTPQGQLLQVIVNGMTGSEAMVVLHDALGRKVFARNVSFSNGTMFLPTDGLQAGQYYLSLFTAEGQALTRAVQISQ